VATVIAFFVEGGMLLATVDERRGGAASRPRGRADRLA